MTVRIPEDDRRGKGSNGDRNYKIPLEKRHASDTGNFASSWNDNGESDKRDETKQAQSNYTGIRINMAGELLSGMNECSGHSSEELLDSVEMEIMQEEEEDHWRKTKDPSAVHSPQKETNTSTTTDEEEGGNYAETMEAAYGQRLHVPSQRQKEERKKEPPKYDQCRFWKHQGRLVFVFAFIMGIFLFLTFWTRDVDKTLAWD